MKTILLVASLLLLSILPASAQRAALYTFGTWDGGTNNIAATSTNTVSNAILAVSEFSTIGVTVSVRPLSTSTGTVVFKFAEGIGSTYESDPSFSITVTLNGTNTVTEIGNFAIPNAGGLAFVQTISTNAMAMTNVVVQARLKAAKTRVETR